MASFFLVVQTKVTAASEATAISPSHEARSSSLLSQASIYNPFQVIKNE
jgi:hypothetical protein